MDIVGYRTVMKNVLRAEIFFFVVGLVFSCMPIWKPRPSIQPLPKANESFETIRKKNRVYVDKTHFLAKLLDNGQKLIYFTRARKFGKTLFLQMVHKFFLGEKALFKNLKIHERGNTIQYSHKKEEERIKNKKRWEKYPVIFLDFSQINYSALATSEEFAHTLHDELKRIGKSYGLGIKEDVFELDTLIERLKKKFDLPVILLIDEFSAPLVSDSKIWNGVHSILETMFSKIESCANSGSIGLAFVTGLARFNTFSKYIGNENFIDVTNDKEFATALGFTPQEIDIYFKEHIKKFVEHKNKTRDEIMRELVHWYADGYQISSKEVESRLLNPVSTIKCLKKQHFGIVGRADDDIRRAVEMLYTTSLTTACFDDRELKQSDLFTNPIIVGSSPNEIIFDYFCMLFAGFVTIKKYNPENDTCVLGYPNREIKEYFGNQLSSYVLTEKKFFFELPDWTTKLRESMLDKDITLMMKTLNLFGFPYPKETTNEILSRFGYGDEELSRGEYQTFNLGQIRRLHLIFDAAGIRHDRKGIRYIPKELIRNQTSQHIYVLYSLQTLELPTNYVIIIKHQGKTLEDLFKIINQSVLDKVYSLGNQSEVFLVGLSFTGKGKGEVEEWICVPYEPKDKKMVLDRIEASTVRLADRIKHYLYKRLLSREIMKIPI